MLISYKIYFRGLLLIASLGYKTKIMYKGLFCFLRLLLIATLLISYTACRKADVHMPDEQLESSLQKFFTTSDTTLPLIKEISRNILKQNKEHHFLNSLIKRVGYPKWDNAIVSHAGSLQTSRAEAGFTVSGTYVYIPFVKDSATIVNSALTIIIKGADTTYKMLYASQYKNYSFGQTGNSPSIAQNVAYLFLHFQKTVFGHTQFKITDKRLVKLQNPKGLKESIFVKLKPAPGTNSQSATTRWISSTECWDVWWDPDGDADACDCSGNEVFDHTECNTTWIFIAESVVPAGGSSSGSSGVPTSGGGGGSSSGGSTGNNWSDDPCIVNGDTQAVLPAGDCMDSDPGWVPINNNSTIIPYLGTTLSLNETQVNWLDGQPSRADEINKFLRYTSYSDLTFEDKKRIATDHLSKMMGDADYLAMNEDYALSVTTVHPWMIELFRELAIEIGFKIIKKYIPGYGDWQSIKDAIHNGSQGDWLGVLGEVINIAKKKVPWLVAIDATIDAFDFAALANKAWKAFDKIRGLPTNAFNSLVKTIKNKCGGILGNLVHDNTLGPNSKQAFLKLSSDPNVGRNFFDDLASDLGVSVRSFNTANGAGAEFDLPQGFMMKFYPQSSGQNTTTGIFYPTIEILQNGITIYKLRFIN